MRELTDHERMTLAALRLAEAWVEFWDCVRLSGRTTHWSSSGVLHRGTVEECAECAPKHDESVGKDAENV